MENFYIIHNCRCSKSRAALELLQSRGATPKIIDYLKGELTREILLSFLDALKVSPKEILRTKEEEFKALDLDLEESDQVIDAILKHPKILERPIVMKGKEAVIGRPPENVLRFFK